MSLPAWRLRLRTYLEPRGILRFVEEQYHAELDPWQEEALLLFESPAREDQRISLQACIGPGKTAVIAMAMGWFMGCCGDRDSHPRALATAITGDNLRDNLWSELAKWQSRSVYLSSQFTWTSTRFFAKRYPQTWFIGVRSWPKTANVDELGKTFSGLHAPYVAAFIDESGGIPPGVLRAADQALVRCLFGKVMQAGNPISLEGMLHAAANELRDQWRIVRITGDPDDPKAWVHSPRVGPEPLAYAKQQIATYGRENPWVMSYILGLFPPASINSLLGIEDVQIAMERVLPPESYEWAQKRLGIDVARFGDDRTVIFPRQGLMCFKPRIMRHERDSPVSVDVADAVMEAKESFGSEMEFIDATGGWGAGTIDVLRAAGHGPISVQFHAKAVDQKYANRRAEGWMNMAKAIKEGAALPKVPALVAELTKPTYTFVKGKFLLEDKAMLKKRLGTSPDIADALAQTYMLPDMPGQMMAQSASAMARSKRGHRAASGISDDEMKFYRGED